MTQILPMRVTEAKALLQNFNKDVRGWGKNVVRSARFNVPDGQSTFTTTPDNYRKSRDNIKEGYRSEGTSYGKKIYRIGFNFPIQGVMIHYGLCIYKLGQLFLGRDRSSLSNDSLFNRTASI